MKTLYYLILAVVFSSQFCKAQVALDTVYVSNKKSIESFSKVRYYYYPNLQAYFDTRRALYLYKQDAVWITSETLPASYRGYSLKNTSYVVLKGYIGDEPYTLLDQHKKEFPADFSSKRKPPKVIVVSR